MARAKIITGGTKTVKAVFSEPSEMFTPNWDKQAAGAQAMDRTKLRARMGQKMTPKGAGVLIKKARK